jgi:hypothetical protein
MTELRDVIFFIHSQRPLTMMRFAQSFWERPAAFRKPGQFLKIMMDSHNRFFKNTTL